MYGSPLGGHVARSRHKQRAGGDRRCRERRHGRCPPRRHGRGVEPGVDRESTNGRDGYRRSIQDRGSEPWHLPGRIHARRIQNGQAGRHHSGRHVHGAGQRRASSRPGGRDAHRHGRVAGRRRHQQHDVVCRQPRDSGHDSHDRSQHRVARAAHPRNNGDAVRPRTVQPHQPRLGERGLHDRDRRAAREQPVRQRPVQRLLHERRERPGADLQHRLGIGGNPEQRHPRQHRAEGWRQQVLRLLLRARPRELAAIGQPDGRRQGGGPRNRRDGVQLPDQPVVRRTDRARQGVVLPHLQVRGRQDLCAEREVPGRQPGVSQPDGQLQRRRPDHLGGLQQGQDPSLRREAIQRRVLQRLQHVCGVDTGGVDRRLGQRVDPASPVDARAVEQAPLRGRPRLLHAALRAELLRDRTGGGLAAPQRLDRPLDGPVRLSDTGVFEHDGELQLDGVGQLHHRFARHEVRHDRRLGQELADVRAEGQHQHADHGQRPRCDGLSVPGRGLQHADDRHPEGEQRLRQLRAGHVDHEPAHAELRRPIRPLQRRGRGSRRGTSM